MRNYQQNPENINITKISNNKILNIEENIMLTVQISPTVYRVTRFHESRPMA